MQGSKVVHFEYEMLNSGTICIKDTKVKKAKLYTDEKGAEVFLNSPLEFICLARQQLALAKQEIKKLEARLLMIEGK